MNHSLVSLIATLYSTSNKPPALQIRKHLALILKVLRTSLQPWISLWTQLKTKSASSLTTMPLLRRDKVETQPQWVSWTIQTHFNNFAAVVWIKALARFSSSKLKIHTQVLKWWMGETPKNNLITLQTLPSGK
jgi:hypothetical protein